MINYIWAFMFIVGLGYAAWNGKMEAVNRAIFKAAEEGVTLSLGLIFILIFWLGVMKIAEASGLLSAVSKLFKPLLKRLFPDIPEDHPAMGYIVTNTVSNMFGLGNAATPMGIKAMEALKRLNRNRPTASRSMVTLLALNTSGFTLIPTTVIAVRMKYGAAEPTDIVVPTLLATAVGTLSAVLIDRYFYYRRQKKGRDD
ncbi:MAG: spore maturation protein [Bacillaceae bacterium G1]|jgi:spore maturation protein A|uniref:nucleoside recognition domain-containing protein n=1 Tax=Caenibacillus caldisaponilyticus TaxID=1674942 RepID=UPI000921DDD7|nr:nucleoside recognition domain-containing protein [Caenibacillus caldisaponilyticus]OJF16694.1 MAG: spore maturation protein [Bacillaceae bacterium G1]